MWLYRLTVALTPVWSIYWRLRLEGAVDKIPAQGPLIATMNHESFMDPWFLAFVFPRPLRYLISDKWYYGSRLSRFLFHANGTIPLRASDPLATIEDICSALERGEAVGIFPEGRISGDGRIRRFRAGFARAAARSGAPVVPLGMRGSFESLPRTRRWPRPGTIEVHVGKPLRFPGSPMEATPPMEQVQDFRRLVFEETCRLSAQDNPLEKRRSAAVSKQPSEREPLGTGQPAGPRGEPQQSA